MTTVAPPELVDGRWPIEHCAAPECKAPIVWAVSVRGKPTPVDATPRAGGNVLLVEHPGPVPQAVVRPKTEAETRTDLRFSHFATCAKAERFRRPR